MKVITPTYRAVGWMRADGSLHKGCPPIGEPSGFQVLLVVLVDEEVNGPKGTWELIGRKHWGYIASDGEVLVEISQPLGAQDTWLVGGKTYLGLSNAKAAAEKFLGRKALVDQEVQHVCGAQGFDALSDVCLACEQRETRS